MTKAFVFGKFLPFHKGHEAMIHFALARCDFLCVMICCSERENIPCSVRKQWIEQTFINSKNIVVKTFHYLESELINTSDTSLEVSAIWATIFKKELPGYSLLITSENYGNLVASFMNIEHIAFDINKTNFPFSATSISNDLFKSWQFLPDSVKPSYAIKVVILGTESTGKTTLTEDLSKHYNCSFVPEAAREIITNSNLFCFDDLDRVAQEHSRRIQLAATGSSRLVIIDTDIHITKSYSKFIFNKKLAVNDTVYSSNKADLYLYLNNDVNFLQDGTRLSETERNLLDLSHRTVLKDHNIEILEINGSWDDRFQKAIKYINKLLARNKKRNSRYS